MLHKKVKRIVLGAVAIIIIFVITLYFVRLYNIKQVDDVTPGIPCEDSLLVKSDILWVIPIFNNYSIADFKDWCEIILSLNKTIGLHGIYHTYNEFSIIRDKEYLQTGVDAFEKCFGFRPRIFKAPQVELSDSNRDLLVNEGFKIYGQYGQVTHKVYHCDDTGDYSNKFIDWF